MACPPVTMRFGEDGPTIVVNPTEELISLPHLYEWLLSGPSYVSKIDPPRPKAHNEHNGFEAAEPGYRKIDSLILALAETERGIQYGDAPDAVEKHGWRVETPKPAETVKSRARRYPLMIQLGDGRYRLTEQGHDEARRIREIRAKAR